MLTRATVVDEDGNPLPAGTPGELVLQGNLVAPGYFGDPAATAEAQRGGWLHTGDVAHIDTEGFVYIVDRKKDMIISGGFNVFSNEVEAAINSHPGSGELRGDRCAGPQVGRSNQGHRRAPARRRRVRTDNHRVVQGETRQCEGAEERGVLGGVAPHARREGAEEGNPRPILGGHRARRELIA